MRDAEPTTAASPRLVWQEEFDFYNAEFWSAADPIAVEDGQLKLFILQDYAQALPYSTGSITTRGKLNFDYGRIDIRAKLPRGRGIVTAIRLVGDAAAYTPAMTIAEIDGARPDELYHGTALIEDGHAGEMSIKSTIDDVTEDFHIYSVAWDEQMTAYYLDSVLLSTESRSIPEQPLYLLLETRVVGEGALKPDHTTVFPNVMLVDYIRYYR